ncbi:hypothetical protein T08_8047 [Trichinella sp. T8]|nr:hypothetical protein T08_8047 [Trichinella sp. T8]
MALAGSNVLLLTPGNGRGLAVPNPLLEKTRQSKYYFCLSCAPLNRFLRLHKPVLCKELPFLVMEITGIREVSTQLRSERLYGVT